MSTAQYGSEYRPSRPSRDGNRGRLRTFLLAFGLSIVIASTAAKLLLPSAQAQIPGAPQPSIVVQDFPARVEGIIRRNLERLASRLKVAQDVAVKTGIRLFYRKLAEATTNFVMTAGTGQSTLFVTKGSFYQDLQEAAVNDFIDNLSTEYFGTAVAAQGAEKERVIGLLARGILSPGTGCENQCQKEYNDIQGRIRLIDAEVKIAEVEAKKTPPPDISCPLLYQNDVPQFTLGDPVTIPAVTCLQDLSRALSDARQTASRSLSSCFRGCQQRRVQLVADDPDLGELIGNEAVAASVKDLFQPEKNQLGTLTRIINTAQNQAARDAEAQKVADQAGVRSAQTLAGLVKAPATLTEKIATQGIEKATEDITTLTGSHIADVVSSAFGAALSARLIKEYTSNCGLNPQACKKPAGTSPQSRFIFAGPTINEGQQAAAAITARLGRVDLIPGDPSRNPVSVLDELESNGIIDQRFRQAVEEKLTVQEAIDRGFLDANGTFGFTDTNQEPLDGYPYRSMLFLRHARIIPVGWEMAALYIRDFDPIPGSANAQPRAYGLGDLMTQFEVCGQDDAHDAEPETAGLQASPYCGLVDPNWVLKAPLTYCRKEGAGEEVLIKTFVCDEDTNGNGRIDCGTSDRGGDLGRFDIQRKTEVCVDDPSCVAENEDGSCRTYGYCFQDRPTFRFEGTQCPVYYASCQDYTNEQGETVAYLNKTIDRDGCSSENAGCLSYCGDARDNDQTWLCQGDPAETNLAVRLRNTATCPAGQTCTCHLPDGRSCTVPGGGTTCEVPPPGQRHAGESAQTCTLGINYFYFDRDVEQCDAAADGCREFVDTIAPTNVLANGGFEIYDDTTVPARAFGWSGLGGIDTSDLNLANTTVGAVLPGGGEARFVGDPDIGGFDTGRPIKAQSFTLSFYARTRGGGSCNGSFGVRSADGNYVPASENVSYGSAWTRYVRTFQSPEPASIAEYDNTISKHVIQPYWSGAGCDVLIDNAQLELSPTVTEYKSYATVNGIYMNKSRRTCNRVDVGCETYISTTTNESVNGIANWTDLCTEENVGCRAYRKEAITHVPSRDAEDLNLVARSGRGCPASDVGCEEYTNLDVAAAGGEAREYYTSIRQCVKPVSGAPDQSTFFTWTGSDRTGYQLKSFRLKLSDTTVSGETGRGPCTNIALGTSTGDNNPPCLDSTQPVATCTPAESFTDPDCSQFFDTNGNVFYRRPSRTIPVSDECHPYRNTVDDRAGADAIYHILASESTSCPATSAQCRAFTGSAGNNTRTIFTDNFEGENVVTNHWQGAADLSTESVNAGGRSMWIHGTADTKDVVLTGKIPSRSSFVMNFWAKPQGSTTVNQVWIRVGTTDYKFLQSPLPIAQEWHRYTVGPVTITDDPGTQTVRLRISTDAFLDNIELQEITNSVFLIDGSFRTCDAADVGCDAYRDRSNGTHFIKSFSRLCSSDVVGCTAMIDTQNSQSPFSSLPIRGVTVPADRTVTLIDNPRTYCNAADKGCSAFGAPTIDVSKKVTSYQTVYLRDQPDRHGQILCTPVELQCAEFTSRDGSRTYFKNPGAQTCEYKRVGGDADFHWYITGTAVRCPVVTPPSTGVPTGRACVKACVGGSRNGLACTDNRDCPADAGRCDVPAGQATGACVGGVNNGDRCTDPTDCASGAGTCNGSDGNVGRSCTTSADCNVAAGNICDLWTGICPDEQSGCNEYRDPSDPNPCRSTCGLEVANGQPVPVDDTCRPTLCDGGDNVGHPCRNNADCPNSTCSGEGIPGCRSYSYIRQTVEAGASECSGRVDIALGCRPFNDTSNPTLNFRAF